KVMESVCNSKVSAEEIIPSKAPAPPTITYRIDLNYIGTPFYGWQSQPHGNTVQDQIEKALATILREKVRISGASRTDTGVHAEHQVATFRLPRELDLRKTMRSLEALIPEAIGITGLTLAEPGFHPIQSAHAKLYRYRFWLGRGSNAFTRRYTWAIPYDLNLDAMKEASRAFAGRHNFKSLAAMDGSAKTFERTILDIQWAHKGENLVEIYLLGEGFLKQMVRNLVGTLVEVGQGKRTPGEMALILAAQDRTKAGMTAPANGLSLVEIHYEEATRVPEHFLSSAAALSFAYPRA
ncbi:MAG: tRNA pseudouridine(38-40) synthase TruA, partial [Bdellovibrionota bacterium]